MVDYEKKFDTSNIHSVELNLLDGQVELILRALELYGYNLEYMLNGNDATEEQKQEKISMLKYTYEQILASQAEQVDTKVNNLDNLNSFGKLLSNNFGNIKEDNNGSSTYRSMNNLVNLGYKKVLIVSQKYHLYRCLYNANELGLDAYAISSREINYSGQLKRDIREVLARVKDFILNLM